MGIIAGITAGVATALTAVGIGAATAAAIAPIAVGVVGGAALGAATSAISGGNVGMGALGGALTGGFGGVGGEVGGLGGLAIGAGGGALSSAITGGNPLIGAALGGLGAYAGESGLGTTGMGLTSDNGILSSSGLGSANAAAYANMTPEQQVASDVAAENAGVSDLTAAGTPDFAAADTSNSSDVQNLLYGNSPSGAGGALSTAAGAAPTKGLDATQVALGLLAGGAQLLSKPTAAQQQAALPGPSSTAATQGPLFNTPLAPAAQNRTAVTPPVTNWFTYGQNPAGEQTFFTNNSLKFARGGALTAANDEDGIPEFDSDTTPDRMVHGDSGGQDDDVNAKLSDGEWVADANFVSALGDGNNVKGSKVLYQLRRDVMHDKGMKHEVPPKLKKSPLQYAAQAQKKVAGAR